MGQSAGFTPTANAGDAHPEFFGGLGEVHLHVVATEIRHCDHRQVWRHSRGRHDPKIESGFERVGSGVRSHNEMVRPNLVRSNDFGSRFFTQSIGKSFACARANAWIVESFIIAASGTAPPSRLRILGPVATPSATGPFHDLVLAQPIASSARLSDARSHD